MMEEQEARRALEDRAKSAELQGEAISSFDLLNVDEQAGQSLAQVYQILSQGSLDPWMQMLQSAELPTFTVPELMQACSQVLEQLCNVTDSSDDAVAFADDVVEGGLLVAYRSGEEITVADDVLLDYLAVLATERSAFSCIPSADFSWIIRPVSG